MWSSGPTDGRHYCKRGKQDTYGTEHPTDVTVTLY